MTAAARQRALWRERAERLGTQVPCGRLHPEVLTRIRRAAPSEAPPRGAKDGWGVALSGGADSLALLLLVWAHWPERRDGLVALHFDHRLRGAASRADAAFCRGVCRALGVGFVLGSWRRPPGAPSEAEARTARLGFLAGACRRRRIGFLWFGHQKDDVAETMLMRLARGSGTGGLAAPRPVAGGADGPVRLRPLLGLRKREIQSALRACGARWREDSSNAEAVHFRNRVRSRVVARWEKASDRDAVGGAALSRELLQEDDEALEAWTASRCAVTPGGKLGLKRLAGCPRAVWRRALHHWLLAQGGRIGGLSRGGFTSLLAAVQRGRPVRHSLGARTFAVIRGEYLRIETAPAGARPRRSV